MRRAEFQDWLDEVADTFRCEFLLETYPTAHRKGDFEITGKPRLNRTDGRDVERINIGKAIPKDITSDDLVWRSASIGLVIADPPEESGDQLVQAWLAVKTDWQDNKTDEHWDNPALREFYMELRKPLVKRLHNGMWMYDVRGGIPDDRVRRDVHYSDGAEAWLAAGGTLLQFKDGRFAFLTEKHYRARTGSNEGNVK
jgi:hypothetical protein